MVRVCGDAQGRVSAAHTLCCTTHGSCRGGVIGRIESEASDGIPGGLELISNFHGFGLDYCR